VIRLLVTLNGLGSRGLGSFLVVACALAVAPFAPATLGGEVYCETYEVHRTYDPPPAFGQTIDTTLPVQLFDTQGGTRQLLDVGYYYFQGKESTVVRDTSPYSTDAGARVDYRLGVDMYPFTEIFHTSGGALLISNYFYVWPHAEGTVDHYGGGLEWGQTDVPNFIHEDAHKAAFLGTGIRDWPVQVVLSDLVYSDNIPYPGPLPPHQYAPELLHVTMNSMSVDLMLWYYYTIVPEPGTLSLGALFGLLALRRR
jgi:hypothetical protein